MAGKPHNPMIARRHKARHYALQALYQWHMAEAPLAEIEAQFRAEYDFEKVDGEYFHDLLHGVPANIDELEEAFAPHMVERDLAELDPVERALLRLATYELAQRIDVPFKVVINEAVGLAKKFGASESHRFVNGVLDRTACDLRPAETAANAAGR